MNTLHSELKNSAMWSHDINTAPYNMAYDSKTTVSIRKELGQQRANELFDSCKDEVLKQIIGPFGLTKAMFNDKDGGNVTTAHNFEKGICATEDDKAKYAQLNDYERSKYDKDLPNKRKEMFKSNEPIVSAYTGKELSRDGQTHLDHVVAAENIERDPAANLFMNQEERVAMANNEKNLVPCEASINQSMGKKDKKEWAKTKRKADPGKTNAESFDVSMESLNKTVKTAEKHVEYEILKAQVKKQAPEVLLTGADEAARNALRQAMGMVLHELVTNSYSEIKRISGDPELKENFVDNVIVAIKNIADNTANKSEHIFKNALSGGVQGFISNLLTFIINNIITTSAKVVTIIREGLKGLWEAVKLIINPPTDMSGIEVARQATKIIGAVITASLGILFEKSIEAFIMSIPVLVPLAPILSPAITALLTGITTAFVTFGIDKLFDWLNDSGTDMINAQIEHMEANSQLFERMAQMIDIQFNNSEQYRLCTAQNNLIMHDLNKSGSHMKNAIENMQSSIESRVLTIKNAEEWINNFESIDENEIDAILNKFNQ